MAKNYDNYGYDNDRGSNTSLIRRILIVLMVVVAIILIIYLITSCTRQNNDEPNEDKNKTKYNYESELLAAGKNYYTSHYDENPTTPGECSVVELQTLVDEKLIDADKFKQCNRSTTYVKVCILENERKQYTPWVSCMDYYSDEKYNSLVQGSTADIIADETYVEFKFIAQEASKGGDILGPVETYWKKDIPYTNFKTLASTKYYRYRDKLYQWNLVKRFYYSRTGEVADAAKVKDYYITAPSTVYNIKGESATGYKWYTPVGTKDYYKKNTNNKYPSTTQPEGYPYRDPQGIDVTRYRTRTVKSQYDPTMYFECATSATGTRYIYQTARCGTTNNPSYNYTRRIVYSCANETNGLLVRENIVDQGTKCKTYSEWSNATTTACDTTKTDICQKATVTFYYWYRMINETKKYYPSNKTYAVDEKVYYVNKPADGLYKDTSTKATVYKWYRELTTVSTKYTATAPSGYYKATKSSEYQWSDWSDWNTKNPKATDGRDRTIETKTKIKLQEIQGSSVAGWNNVSNDYLSEEALIRLFNNKGYKVNTLEDITNNGQIRYQLVTYVRNKKESK